MRQRSQESHQKLRGGYYTSSDIAQYLARWVLASQPKTLLEPSCGDGAFIRAVAAVPHDSLTELFAAEPEEQEAQKAQDSAVQLEPASTSIYRGDFLGWAQRQLAMGTTVQGVLGNPPFIRYQYLSDQMQKDSEQLFSMAKLRFTRHTNAWVPFVIASLMMLSPGGRLAMVLPAELLHVLHAGSLRQYLLSQCDRVLVLDPSELWFDDTQQGVVLLLAEKRQTDSMTASGLAVRPIQHRDALCAHPNTLFDTASYEQSPLFTNKWMAALLSVQERSLLVDLANHSQTTRLAEVADVDVGIVTGANQFFLVNEATLDTHGLRPYARAMFGRSGQVAGVIYDSADHRRNQDAQLPVWFLDFRQEEKEPLPAAVLNYIASGEAQELHLRYKCRIRTPWYVVPSVWPAPVAMLKRSHHFPRLVHNVSGALSTDTAYRIQPHHVSSSDLVASGVNSLTSLCAELEGRHYGGGVLELVPSEIERLLLPRPPFTPEAIAHLDTDVRKRLKPLDILERHDARVLPALGLSSSSTVCLREAWHRLRSRRQRRPKAGATTKSSSR